MLVKGIVALTKLNNTLIASKMEKKTLNTVEMVRLGTDALRLLGAATSELKNYRKDGFCWC